MIKMQASCRLVVVSPFRSQLVIQRRNHKPRATKQKLQISNLFTGIVQGTATVQAVENKPDFRSLSIKFPDGATSGVQIGASVAINGTCLTVVSQSGDTLHFDIIAESLKRTNLGLLNEGSPVNFERSARVGDEIGGHTVSGHVHTTAALVDIEQTEDNRRLEFEVKNPSYMKYILPKGFVAVDGCSLTVGEVTDSTFSVYLIPETLRVTTLGNRAVGDLINVEVEAQTQAIVDTVERVVAQYLENNNKGARGQQRERGESRGEPQRRSRNSNAGSSYVAYIGNLPFDAEEEDLAEMFEEAQCNVARIRVIRDKDSGRPRGFAFVDFADEESLDKAVRDLTGAMLMGRDLRVSYAERN